MLPVSTHAPESTKSSCLCRMFLNIFYICMLPPFFFFSLLLLPLACLSLIIPFSAVERFLPSGLQDRSSTALFDVPSPLILYTWTVFCTDCLLNRSTACSFPSFIVFLSRFFVGPCRLVWHELLFCPVVFQTSARPQLCLPFKQFGAFMLAWHSSDLFSL